MLERFARRRKPEALRSALGRALDSIEQRIHRLHDALFSEALTLHGREDVRALVRAILEDKRNIFDLCTHRCDHADPELSLLHDQVNNEETLGLFRQLAIATPFNLRDRVLLLHQLQREICRKLKALGIDTSQN